MPNFHPLVVHFPIAILTVSILFDLMAKLLKREEFSRVGWWTQLAGSLGLGGAVISGLLAEKSINIPDAARGYFETHEQIAFLNAVIFAVLLLWRIGCRAKLPQRYQPVFFLIFLVGVIALWTGAWYGGEMVYRFGTGVGFSPH